MLQELVTWCQWPAMAMSIAGSWYLGAPGRRHRHRGFVVLIASNLLWSLWAVVDHAWALLAMQGFYLLLNGRGLSHTIEAAFGSKPSAGPSDKLARPLTVTAIPPPRKAKPMPRVQHLRLMPMHPSHGLRAAPGRWP